jgi:hypothetical protein
VLDGGGGWALGLGAGEGSHAMGQRIGKKIAATAVVMCVLLLQNSLCVLLLLNKGRCIMFFLFLSISKFFGNKNY